MEFTFLHESWKTYCDFKETDATNDFLALSHYKLAQVQQKLNFVLFSFVVMLVEKGGPVASGEFQIHLGAKSQVVLFCYGCACFHKPGIGRA